MKNIRTHKCKVETQTQIGNQIVSILPRKYRLFLSILEPDRVEENDIKVRIRFVTDKYEMDTVARIQIE